MRSQLRSRTQMDNKNKSNNNNKTSKVNQKQPNSKLPTPHFIEVNKKASLK